MTRITASTLISKAIVTYCGIRPTKIVPLDKGLLQKSSLGKISRSRLRKSFEKGDIDKYIQQDTEITAEFMSSMYQPATTATEGLILLSFAKRFGAVGNSIGVGHDLFDLGASSLDVLGLKLDLQKSLNIGDIPLSTFFSQSVISNLAKVLDQFPKIGSNQDNAINDSLDSKDIQETPVNASTVMSAYDPVVILNPKGTKTPIFFFHPGVGEVMIFMNISRYFVDRPVYALRARGFDGEPFFTSMNEIYTTYLAAIRCIQPHGPYLFVGYSFGSIVAFEITKILQYLGEEVKFLATIDQTPHFKERAKNYDWYECVLTLASFLGFVKERLAYSILPIMRKHQHSEVLEYIFDKAPKERVQELSMSPEKLDKWAQLALQLKKCVAEWDPEGKVKHMDVFYCEPLIGLVKAKDIKDWRENYIGKWDAYVEGGAKYHEVGGTHRTLISPPNLVGFWKEFKRAMDERGV
jgi:thioesterase domain-containing protein